MRTGSWSPCSTSDMLGLSNIGKTSALLRQQKIDVGQTTLCFGHAQDLRDFLEHGPKLCSLETLAEQVLTNISRAFHLAWSTWRRRHHARARRHQIPPTVRNPRKPDVRSRILTAALGKSSYIDGSAFYFAYIHDYERWPLLILR